MRDNTLSLTLLRGMKILDLYCNDFKDITASEVSSELQISRAAARRLLITFVRSGYLHSLDNKKFNLSDKFLRISGRFLKDNTIISSMTKIITDFSAKTGLPVSIVKLDGKDVVFLCRSPAYRLYASELMIGDKLPAHASSGGKLLISCMGENFVKEWLDSYSLTAVTANTITNEMIFNQESINIRERKLAVSCDELTIGMSSLSVPIEVGSKLDMAIIVSFKTGSVCFEELVESVQFQAKYLSDVYSNYFLHGG